MILVCLTPIVIFLVIVYLLVSKPCPKHNDCSKCSRKWLCTNREG